MCDFVTLTLLVVLTSCSPCGADELTDEEKQEFWLPAGGQSVEDFTENLGLNDMAYNDVKEKVPELKDLMAQFFHLPQDNQTYDTLFHDVLLEPRQINHMIEEYVQLLDAGGVRKRKRRRRRKRKITSDLALKWGPGDGKGATIMYKIGGDYSLDQQAEIEAAIDHWSENTCLNFERKAVAADLSETHLVFINAAGCSSKLGKQSGSDLEQAIFVSAIFCRPLFGVTVHEIGHAVGMLHEQMRFDRDLWIEILKDRITPQSTNVFINFEIWVRSNVTVYGTAYDMGSVMHYGAMAFSDRITNLPTIVSKDPLYQKTMGQRNGLSFNDIKAVNRAYCNDSCPTPVRECERGGIVHPKNCSKCICPDGYGGDSCETVDPRHDCGDASGQILTATSTEQCIQSVNYGTGSYDVQTQCNWHLQAPEASRIQIYFQDVFSVFCHADNFYCYHWVEIKYKGNMHNGFPGPRFCCYDKPTSVLYSDANEAVISFKSNFKDVDADKRQGFKLCFKIATDAPPTEAPPTVAPTLAPTSAPTTAPTLAPTTTPAPATNAPSKRYKCKTQTVTLKCGTSDAWHIWTQPASSESKINKTLDECIDKFTTKKNVTFHIELKNEKDFKVKKLCVTRSSNVLNVTVDQVSAGGGGFHMFKIPEGIKCVTYEDIDNIFVHKLSLYFNLKPTTTGKMKLSGLKLVVCESDDGQNNAR